MKFSTALAAAVLLAASLHAADYQPGELGSLAILLGTQKARTELSVTSSQAARLDGLRSSYREQARAISARKLETPAQRSKAEADLAALTASSNKQALAVLTPDQKADLLALEHKFLGATLLYTGAIQKKVGITPAQSAQIADIRAEALAEVAAINRQFEDGEISFARRLAKLRAARISDGRKILGLLNPIQKDAFAQLGGAGGC